MYDNGVTLLIVAVNENKLERYGYYFHTDFQTEVITMKKVVIILATTTILFFGMWLQAITDHAEDAYAQCQRYAEGAVGHLLEYEKYKDINDESYIGQYWGSVSIFYAFMDTLYSLPDDGGWNKAMYSCCDVLYDHMLLAPDEVLSHIDEVLAALELVGEDFTSFEARSAMSELSYNLQYVWG